MIRDIMPPWVFPTAPTVQVFDKNKSRYVEGYYCFETQRWKDIKGLNIVTIGWKHHERNRLGKP